MSDSLPSKPRVRVPAGSPEVWLPVPGWEGLYEASSAGRVRSIDRIVVRCDGVVWSLKGKVLRQAACAYPTVALSRNGKPRSFEVHALIARTFIGPCPKGQEVCHNDGVRTNNWCGNLRYDTRKGNVADAYVHHDGLNRGSKHYKAMLSDEQIGQILNQLAPWHGKRLSGGIGARLAQQYAVSPSFVTLLHKGERRIEVPR